jgi:hypothetical protein
MEKIEIHYYLENDLHSMDAFIKNKAESELLKVFKEISDILELDLCFEIEALKQGGIKEFIRVLKKKTTRKQFLRVLVAIGVIFSGVVTNVISDNLTKDNEFEKLKKEETILQIKKLKKELEEDEVTDLKATLIIENLTILISNTDKIKLYKSNFYSSLLNEPKIEKISTTELDNDYKPLSKERIVYRADFKSFVIDKIRIESEFIEDANIEIVSPVLNNGQMKWKGFYDSKPLSFNLIDSDFRNSVLNREISFSNGTSIKCSIEFEKEMDNEGNIKITEVNVTNVLNVFEGDKTILTKKGKQIIEDRKQLTINFDQDEKN